MVCPNPFEIPLRVQSEVMHVVAAIFPNPNVAIVAAEVWDVVHVWRCDDNPQRYEPWVDLGNISVQRPARHA